MIRVLKIILLILVVSGCRDAESASHNKVNPHIDALVTLDGLSDWVKNTAIWIDTRSREQYLDGHIPGAINIARNELVDTTYRYSGMKIAKEDLRSLLRQKGISSNNHLVLYDNGGSAEVARLWWLLNHYGFENVSILDGGIAAWKDSGMEVSSEIHKSPSSEFEFRTKKGNILLADMMTVKSVVNNPNSRAVILDVRSADEYSGALLRKGNRRAGRIPGSINKEWVMALHPQNRKIIADSVLLELCYGNLGDRYQDTIIVYCQSGVRSSHTTFVLSQLLKYKNVMNYDGSWSEWNYHTDLPIERDSIELN